MNGNGISGDTKGSAKDGKSVKKQEPPVPVGLFLQRNNMKYCMGFLS